MWTAVVQYSFPHAIFPLRIKNSLKLVLLFSKGPYDPEQSPHWFLDLIKGDSCPETKTLSQLQQGVEEFEYLIDTFTNRGDLVVDPFLGTGTTAVASKRKDRRFIGSEILKDRYDLSLSRLGPPGSPET